MLTEPGPRRNPSDRQDGRASSDWNGRCQRKFGGHDWIERQALISFLSIFVSVRGWWINVYDCAVQILPLRLTHYKISLLHLIFPNYRGSSFSSNWIDVCHCIKHSFFSVDLRNAYRQINYTPKDECTKQFLFKMIGCKCHFLTWPIPAPWSAAIILRYKWTKIGSVEILRKLVRNMYMGERDRGWFY